MSLDYSDSTAGVSRYLPPMTRSKTKLANESVKTITTNSPAAKRAKQITLNETNARVRTAYEKILNNFDKSTEISIFDEAIVEGMPEKFLNSVQRTFSMMKFAYEYDSEKLFIVGYLSEDHQNAANEFISQLRNFAVACNKKFTLSGGDTRIDRFTKNDKDFPDQIVQPDALLKFFVKTTSTVRVAFELEYGNRSIRELRDRLHLYMNGWTDCSIAIGCKYFKREKNGNFEAIAIVYYQRNNNIRLARILDIGVNALKEKNMATIEDMIIEPNNEAIRETRRKTPANQPVTEAINTIGVETPPIRPINNRDADGQPRIIPHDLAFYQVEIDHALLFERIPQSAGRPRLIIDFFELSSQFYLANLGNYRLPNVNNEQTM